MKDWFEDLENEMGRALLCTEKLYITRFYKDGYTNPKWAAAVLRDGIGSVVY